MHMRPPCAWVYPRCICVCVCVCVCVFVPVYLYRIGIFVRGAMRCIGSGLRLKTRYGEGLKLSVGIATARTARSTDTPDHADTGVARDVYSSTGIQQGTSSPGTAPVHDGIVVTEGVGGSLTLQARVQAVRALITERLAAVRAEGDSRHVTEGLPATEACQKLASPVAEAPSKLIESPSPVTTVHGKGRNASLAGSSIGDVGAGVSQGALHYEHFTIPISQEACMPEILMALQDESARLGVQDVQVREGNCKECVLAGPPCGRAWLSACGALAVRVCVQVGLTSLEDVFLAVVKKAGGASAR